MLEEMLEEAIRRGEESLYGAFAKLCSESLPADADDRYKRLRDSGYVVRDEADICVYVSKVARRHEPKFRWLYDSLFREYPAVFQNELDLVVWGCGCGLDLLALYDRAMKQRNPQLWLTVRSVTLVDLSEVALASAKEIAELLFPCAKGRINTFRRDFRRPQEINVSIPRSFIYTPRLHLVSNVLDLLSEDELVQFAGRIHAISGRYGNFLNDVFVAFSPEYRNWDTVPSEAKMRGVRNFLGNRATEVKTAGDEPAQCAFAVCLSSSATGRTSRPTHRRASRSGTLRRHPRKTAPPSATN